MFLHRLLAGLISLPVTGVTPTLLRSLRPLVVAAMAGLLATTQTAVAEVAPTPNTIGPNAVTSVFYKFPATIDPLVTQALPTELWAILWRPQNLPNRRLPIVLLVHGNHATCGRPIPGTPFRDDTNSNYTTTGQCPPGFVVVPNHLGYNYLAQRLASWGMIVVSVNLNRGITVAPEDAGDPGLILRRARMVLRHLTLLAAWDAGALQPPNGLGFDPRGKFDFGRIGMMGHSRGGDAIVAVPRVFGTGTTWRSRLPANTRFPLLMALAPTDFQASKPVPGNTVFSTLLPMCDGDVSNMQGIRFFDRALKLSTESATLLEKSSFQVWGTNHNGYSTEWHRSDAGGCVGQTPLFPALGFSPRQQTIALNWVLGLTRSRLLGTTTMDRLVDPRFTIPSQITSLTRVDRGFVPTILGRSLVHALDTRLRGGCGDKLAVTNGVTGSCTTWPEHDQSALLALVRWGQPATGGSASPMARFRAGPSSNLDLSRSTTLDVQFGPDCFRSNATTCAGPSSQFPAGTPSTFNQPVSVFLEDSSGRRSNAVRMDQLASNRGPIASQLLPTGAAFHALLRTARIPMSAFGNGYSNRNVRYVWFDFRPTTRGGFIIGEISGQTIAVEQSPALVAEAGGSAGPAVEIADEADVKEVTAMAGEFPPGGVNAADVSRDRNRIISITSVTGIIEAGSERGSDEAQADLVRVELESSRPFPATAAGLTLTIGSFTFTEPDPFQDGSMRRIAFKVPAAVFQSRAEAGDAMSVSAWASMPAWQFGNLDAWMMR